MAEKLILADTSIFIDYFRKTDKANSKLIALFDQGYMFAMSVITHYEIYSGATAVQLSFWENLLAGVSVLPLDEHVSTAAIAINNSLKRNRKQIGLADLFIASTAISNGLRLATLNTKHFERINKLELVL